MYLSILESSERSSQTATWDFRSSRFDDPRSFCFCSFFCRFFYYSVHRINLLCDGPVFVPKVPEELVPRFERTIIFFVDMSVLLFSERGIDKIDVRFGIIVWIRNIRVARSVIFSFLVLFRFLVLVVVIIKTFWILRYGLPGFLVILRFDRGLISTL